MSGKSSRPWRRLAVALAVMAAAGGALLLLAGDMLGVPGPAATPSLPPVPPATEVVADGRVVPVRSAELGVSLPGTISEVAVAEGDRVTEGQPLIIIDDPAVRAEVDAAKAAVTAAEAAVALAEATRTQAVAQREAAEAAVDQAQAVVAGARAARDALPTGAGSAQRRAADAEVAAALAALEVARAQLRAAGGARDAAAAGVTAATADLARAAAGLAAAEAALARLTVTAPFAGIVASLEARIGERATPGIPIVRLADTSSWLIETTDLDETTVARVAVGSRATISFDGLPGVIVEGRVASVALYGALVHGDIVYRVVVEPATIPEGLRWNMTATVTVSAGP
jgi:multidrug resistance efflux pump